MKFKIILITITVLLTGICSSSYAAGISVPLGCSLNIGSNSLTVPGDVINAGTLSLTTGILTLTGNFTNTGIFSAGSGSTVIIRSATPSEITGNNDFYDLTIDTNADGAKTVKFGASQTQTVTDILRLAGYAGKILTIRSTVEGTQAKLKIPTSIASGVNYVDVKDNKIVDFNTITAGANSLDSGGNGNWIFGTGPPRTITGSIFQSDRTTKLTTQTVKLSVNGGSVIEKAASGGDFTFSGIPLLSADKLLAWIADDAAYKGNTVVISDGQDLSGLNIYASHVSVKYLTGSSIANSDLSAAKGSLTDSDIKYSVSGGNLSVDDTYKFYIPATFTFSPGGTTAFGNLEIGGAFNAAGFDVTVSGNWDNTSGTYTPGANTTTFNGTNPQTLTSGGSASGKSFNNLAHSGTAKLTLSSANALSVSAALTQSGSGDFDTSANDISSGSLSISSGTFNTDARAGAWDAGNVSMAGGILTATSGNFTVSGNWANTAGSFLHNSGTVIFAGAAAQDVTSGGSSFNNLTITNASDYVSFKDAITSANFTAQTASSKIKFKEGVNFTITGSLTLNGHSASTRLELISGQDGVPWNLITPASSVDFVNVKNSHASNTITAYNSLDQGDNLNWVFENLSITIPESGKTVGTTPTVIGTANAAQTVVIKDISNNIVATTTTDANGNFRTAVSALAAGANSLTAYVGAFAGETVNITVVASPSPDQVPVITSPVSGEAIKGSKPTVTGKAKAGKTVTLTAKDANGNLLLTDVAQSTVDSSGNFTIASSDYTTALPKGISYLNVTVDGVASSIINVSFVDPYGVVFDLLAIAANFLLLLCSTNSLCSLTLTFGRVSFCEVGV